jgi:hypothetical protein
MQWIERQTDPKSEVGTGRVEGKIDVIFDDDTLQQSGEDWCDGVYFI